MTETKPNSARRLYVLCGFLLCVLLTYVGVMYDTQIRNGSYYREQSVRTITTTETVEVEALAYAPPTITEASVYRCDDALLAADDGVHIAARATAGCTGLNGENTVTLTAAYKALTRRTTVRRWRCKAA